MNIEVHGGDLNSAMRVIKKCIYPKDPKLANVEISSDGKGTITLHGTNGTFSASAFIPLMCDAFESFCVDGSTFASVMAMNNRVVSLSTEGQSLVIRGSGRTRIPILKTHVPEIEEAHGNVVTVEAGAFAKACEQIKHAISDNQARIILTGALVETDGTRLTMTALDGFRLATETVKCAGSEVKMVIPGGFISLIASSVADGEMLDLITDGKTLVAETPFVKLKCGLLTGEYVPLEKVMPTAFKAQRLANRKAVLDALKSANAIIDGEKLVRIWSDGETMKVSGNSETADYEEEIPCYGSGEAVNIAFNISYLCDALNTLDTDEVVMLFNGPMSPMIVTRREGEGKRLVLPVRTR